MTPGSLVTHIVFLQSASTGIVASELPITGDLLLNGNIVAPITSALRPDGSYLLSATLPLTASPGDAVSMRYFPTLGGLARGETTGLGNVSSPDSQILSSARAYFDFKLNGELVQPDTISVQLTENGVDAGGIQVANLGTGSYELTAFLSDVSVSYEAVILCQHSGRLTANVQRMTPLSRIVVETVVEKVVTGQTSISFRRPSLSIKSKLRI